VTVKRLTRRIASSAFFFVMSVFVAPVSAEMPRAGDLGEAVQLARQYLESTDSRERTRLSRELAAYDRDWGLVYPAKVTLAASLPDSGFRVIG